MIINGISTELNIIISTNTWDQRIMRADIQRKPPGFQELTPPKYRCVSICVTNLTRTNELLTHSLIFKTKGFLERTDRRAKQKELI